MAAGINHSLVLCTEGGWEMLVRWYPEQRMVLSVWHGQALLTPEDAVLSDELNHASIIDGIRLCKANKYRYKHMDMQDLEAKLKEAQVWSSAPTPMPGHLLSCAACATASPGGELCPFPCRRHCSCRQAWIGKVAKQLVEMPIPSISVRYILSIQEFECVPLPAPLIRVTSSLLGMPFSLQQKHRLRLVATDGAFSMDGDIAPLREICQLAHKYDALVFIDECHATGFLGPNGR